MFIGGLGLVCAVGHGAEMDMGWFILRAYGRLAEG